MGEKTKTCLPMKHLGVLKNLIKNDTVLLLNLEFGGVFSVPDPDLEVRGEGEGEGRSYIHVLCIWSLI